MRNFPFDFLLKTMLDTQSVGSSTFSITPRSTIWLISFFTSSLMWIGHRIGAGTTGVTVGANVMWKVSRNFPIPSKQSVYIRSKSSLHFSGGWSSFTVQFKITNLSLRHVGSPKITGPGCRQRRTLCRKLLFHAHTSVAWCRTVGSAVRCRRSG